MKVAKNHCDGDLHESLTINEAQFFRIDLTARCFQLFEFLKTLHDVGVTKRVTTESLRRYMLWLNLMANMYNENLSTKPLVPPRDIAWLWYCHRLSPVNYKKYVQKICDRNSRWTHNNLMNWKDPDGDSYNVESNSFSRCTWARYYPNEPFDLDQVAGEKVAAHTNSTTDDILLDGFDLLTFARNQVEFYWHIQPFCDKKSPCFVSAVRNYLQFLALLQKSHELKFTPVLTCEIDFVWHTHLTGGSVDDYDWDCKRMCGMLIDRDDSFKIEICNGSVNDSFERTVEHWREMHNSEPFMLSMTSRGYRGPPPDDYYFLPVSAITMDGNSVEETRKNPVSSSLDGRHVDTLSDHSHQQKCTKSILTAYFFLLLGVLFIALGRFFIVPTGYVCGSHPPSLEEIQSRGAPVCLSTPLKSGALCLQAELDPNEPSVWCQNKLAGLSDLEVGYFTLWWSDKDDYGSSWRLSRNRNSKRIKYLALNIERPEPHEAPLSLNWTDLRKMISEDDYTIGHDNYTIEECSSYHKSPNGIPDYCFAAQTMPPLWGLGIAMTTIGFMSATCFRGILLSSGVDTTHQNDVTLVPDDGICSDHEGGGCSI